MINFLTVSQDQLNPVLHKHQEVTKKLTILLDVIEKLRL